MTKKQFEQSQLNTPRCAERKYLRYNDAAENQAPVWPLLLSISSEFWRTVCTRVCTYMLMQWRFSPPWLVSLCAPRRSSWWLCAVIKSSSAWQQNVIYQNWYLTHLIFFLNSLHSGWLFLVEETSFCLFFCMCVCVCVTRAHRKDTSDADTYPQTSSSLNSLHSPVKTQTAGSWWAAAAALAAVLQCRSQRSGTDSCHRANKKEPPRCYQDPMSCFSSSNSCLPSGSAFPETNALRKTEICEHCS